MVCTFPQADTKNTTPKRQHKKQRGGGAGVETNSISHLMKKTPEHCKVECNDAALQEPKSLQRTLQSPKFFKRHLKLHMVGPQLLGYRPCELFEIFLRQQQPWNELNKISPWQRKKPDF